MPLFGYEFLGACEVEAPATREFAHVQTSIRCQQIFELLSIFAAPVWGAAVVGAEGLVRELVAGSVAWVGRLVRRRSRRFFLLLTGY